MNTQQIRYFLAICCERNFTRAAKACHVSQPTLSGAIRRLEREIGGPLFLRINPIALTELGAEVRPWLSKILTAAERTLNAGRNAKADRTRRRTSKPWLLHVGGP